MVRTFIVSLLPMVNCCAAWDATSQEGTLYSLAILKKMVLHYLICLQNWEVTTQLAGTESGIG